MQETTVYWSHFVAVALFLLGLTGFLVRRNAIVILLCLELMLNAVNLIFVEIAARTATAEGTLIVIFTISVAAAEAAVGLCLVLNLYRQKNTTNLSTFKALQG